MRKIFIATALLVSFLQAECFNDRFDINIKEPIALESAIFNIAEECGYSLFIDGEESNRVFKRSKVSFISLKGVKAEEAIEALMHRANLHYQIAQNQIVIRYIDTKIYKIDYINNTRTGSSSSDIKIGGSASASGSSSDGGSSTGNSSTTIKTEEQFDFWTTLADEIYAVLVRPEDGNRNITKESIVVNPRSGIVTVSGTYKQLERVGKYLEETLKSLKKQVMIDVQIIAVDNEGGKATGIDWAQFPLFNLKGTAFGSHSYDGAVTTNTYTIDVRSDEFAFSLSSFLNFLKTQGTTHTLSNPKVLAMNNQPSLISVGDNINYILREVTIEDGQSTESSEQKDIFVGVLLDITPQIDNQGYITLRINPSISELKYAEDNQRQDVTREVAPDTVSRRISSVVRVKDKDVIVLGGLISNFSSVEHSKLPLLGDIPFLGKLFGATRTRNLNREIVFVLTPQIIENGNEITLKDLGYQDEASKQLKPNLRYNVPKIKETNG